MSTFTIPSASNPSESYTVTLGPRSTACTCPDWTRRRGPGCPQEGTECKHITQARAEQYRGYELTAGSLEDGDLERLIAKYQTQPGPVLVALLAEQLDRSQLDRMPAPPPVFHTLDAVLVRARAWRRERREVKPVSGPCTSALDNARLRKYAEQAEADQKRRQEPVGQRSGMTETQRRALWA